MTKKIHVCICCRNEVDAMSFRAIIEAVVDGADYWKHRFGKESSFHLKTVERMHVVDARCTLTDQAINDGADYLWWIDDDMTPPVDTLQRLMERMDANPEYAMVGALCYKKSEPYGPCAFISSNTAQEANWISREPERLQEVSVTGFACLLGRIEAFKAVDEATGHHPFLYHRNCGEDAFFLREARKLGYRVAVDTGLICGHVGSAVFDHNTFGAYAKSRPEVMKFFAPREAKPLPVEKEIEFYSKEVAEGK